MSEIDQARITRWFTMVVGVLIIIVIPFAVFATSSEVFFYLLSFELLLILNFAALRYDSASRDAGSWRVVARVSFAIAILAFVTALYSGNLLAAVTAIAASALCVLQIAQRSSAGA